MFNVITLSREFGSGGGAVAEMLARRLRWKLVDKSLVAEVAQRAQIDHTDAARFLESTDPWFHSLVKGLWRGGYEGVASRVETDVIDSESMAKIGAEVIREAAALGGCVIVGRGSQCVLHNHEGVFHASIFGPRAQKNRRLRERLAPGTDVEQIMEETDRRRAAYVRRFYDADWKDRELYHLTLSSALGLEVVTETILCAAGLARSAS